jgi:16S rRNA (cytosine967-C5)-methyltransferase
MHNKGQIFAFDADRNRLAPIYDRLKRNAARNVQVRAPAPDALSDLVGKMDRVIVDAPCTGAGTWRRRPDAKWRLTPEQLATRQQEQHDILRAAVDYLRPGGQLAYITCSILPEENIEQVKRLISDVPSLSILPPTDIWQKLPQVPDSVTPHFDAFGLTMTPATCGTDGFFISMLQQAT